ncbi:MAG: tRNA dihydrouridine(20/20a) synthase DusA [Gammaproteobacteria bacterium]|nr:tRNA dihydrouridine(20/20a) synthase DusA [Gammaproteobacteria bacterium]
MDNNRIYLAPMVGRTDEHYRFFIRILSKNISLYTEMITCDAFLFTERKNYCVKPHENNLTIQLAGSEPKKYGECAKIIQDQGYHEININIGCPSNKVVKGKFGACLMKSPNMVADFIYEIKENCSLPISIKTRLGLDYDENIDLLLSLINKTKEAGCNKYFIHARNAILNGISPKKNRRIPVLRYSDALRVKNLYPELEIILNGGIEDAQTIKKTIKQFNGIMIGRKIYDDPMFLIDIEKDIYDKNNNITRKEIAETYSLYAIQESKKGISNYFLLRHLCHLYYNTVSSKKWKKFIHNIIQNNIEINKITEFEELFYEEKIKTYS